MNSQQYIFQSTKYFLSIVTLISITPNLIPGSAWEQQQQQDARHQRVREAGGAAAGRVRGAARVQVPARVRRARQEGEVLRQPAPHPQSAQRRTLRRRQPRLPRGRGGGRKIFYVWTENIFMVVPQVGGGGSFVVVPLGRTGRVEHGAWKVTGHQGPVLGGRGIS